MKTKTLHTSAVVLLATGLAAAAGIASAQTAQRIVSRPAIVATPVAFKSLPVTAAPEAVVNASRRSIIIVTPTPLPQLPPNSCFRGNSSGVSRC